jgi:D-sedoheptulose 7-phosphate isomerase
VLQIGGVCAIECPAVKGCPQLKRGVFIMLNAMIDAHVHCLEQLKTMAAELDEVGEMLARCLLGGGKLLICGNGGSASDAQHFAAEIVGRFEQERRAFPALALTTDTSILTAVGNDYGYDEVFARQVAGLGRPDDLLIGISTSGRSENVLRAVRRARSLGMKCVGLLGKDGGPLKPLVDRAIVVPGDTTARIQESHIFILHYWAWQIEQAIVRASGAVA